MPPLLLLVLRCTLIFTLIFAGAQVFNRYCNFNHSCRPFYFSRYIPRVQTGESINLKFDTVNNRKNLEFEAVDPDILTVPNRLNSAIFRVKNLSNKKIGFQPIFETSPKFLASYIEKLQCLCSQKYLLNPEEEMNLEMEFFIDPKIVDSSEFKKLKDSANNPLRIIYRIE